MYIILIFPVRMQWQGDPSNMIDRFDVRAHLDYIPEITIPEVPPEDLVTEERHCNYERYRILAQNAFLGMSKSLMMLYVLSNQLGTYSSFICHNTGSVLDILH